MQGFPRLPGSKVMGAPLQRVGNGWLLGARRSEDTEHQKVLERYESGPSITPAHAGGDHAP